MDVSCIFADFLLGLYICEHTCGRNEPVSKALPEAQGALGIASLIFSCLFMAELLASIWAFGFQYGKPASNAVGVLTVSVDISIPGFIVSMRRSS